jgi:hypothetical protein
MPSPYQQFYENISTKQQLEESKAKAKEQDRLAEYNKSAKEGLKNIEKGQSERLNRFQSMIDMPAFVEGRPLDPTTTEILQDAVDSINKLGIKDEGEYNKAFTKKVIEIANQRMMSDRTPYVYPKIKVKDGVGMLERFSAKSALPKEKITDAFREGLVEAQAQHPNNPEKHDAVMIDWVNKNYPELHGFDSVPESVKYQLDISDPKGIAGNIEEGLLLTKAKEAARQGKVASVRELGEIKKMQPEVSAFTKSVSDLESKTLEQKKDIASLKKSFSDSEKQYEEFKKSQAGYTPYVSQQPYTGEFKAYSQSPESLHPWEGKGFKNYIAPMPTYGLTPGPNIGQESQAMMGGKSIKSMSADELLAYNKYVRERDARVQSSRTPQKPSVQMPEIDQNLTPSERRKQLGGYKGSMIEGMPSEEYWKFHPRN